jgi:hypothetical protein
MPKLSGEQRGAFPRSAKVYSILSSPCCPTKSSLTKLNSPTQMIGVISTPPMGGTILRRGTKKGSVGTLITLKGKRLRSSWGYQVKTIRKIKRKIISPRRGLKIHCAKVVALIKNENIVKVCKHSLSILKVAHLPKNYIFTEGLSLWA